MAAAPDCAQLTAHAHENLNYGSDGIEIGFGIGIGVEELLSIAHAD